MRSRRVVAKNLKSGNVRIFSSARAASKALNGRGTPGSEKTIAKLCRAGGGQFRNTWVSWEK